MTHFYERNIVEIKNEYTIFLTSIMAPLMYEGIHKIYEKARELNKDFKKTIREKPEMKIKDPGILKIFQHLLKGVKNLSSVKIEAETNRIRGASKCTDWFDDLVKAVIKSYIVLLTYNASEKQCKIVNDKIHEKIEINTFIHKCYIQCARNFYKYPELFWHGFTSNEIQRNKREAEDIIENSIIEAIRKMLPMKLVLEEYLKNDYIHDTDDDIKVDVSNSRYRNMKSFVISDLKPTENKILEDTDENNDEKPVVNMQAVSMPAVSMPVANNPVNTNIFTKKAEIEIVNTEEITDLNNEFIKSPMPIRGKNLLLAEQAKLYMNNNKIIDNNSEIEINIKDKKITSERQQFYEKLLNKN